MSMEGCRKGLNPGFKSRVEVRAQTRQEYNMAAHGRSRGVDIRTEHFLGLVPNSWGEARFVRRA